jgi:hypothetical protein
VSFAIPFPSEGFLERLVVWQESGTPVDFSVELLNSQLPYPPGVYAPTDPPADELQAYRLQVPITQPISQFAGEVLSLVDDDFGLGFRNVDGGWTLNQRLVYLVIAPDGGEGPQGPQGPQDSGDTEWNVVIQCRTDVG